MNRELKSIIIRRILFPVSYIVMIICSLNGSRLLVLQPALTIFGGLLFIYSLMQMIRIHSLFPEKHEKPEDFPILLTNGPYRLCRHPFYFWTIMNLLSIPLILGSIPGVVSWTAVFPLWIILMKAEEKELIMYWGKQYIAYMEKTPMLPTFNSFRKYLKMRRKDRSL